ncbi:MAG TPA: DUF4880 domain-containing protein, partial [Humisphaera sp.]
MSHDRADDLVHGYLDGTLTPAEVAELGTWLAASAANAAAFADAVRLDDRLRDVIRADVGRPA